MDVELEKKNTKKTKQNKRFPPPTSTFHWFLSLYTEQRGPGPLKDTRCVALGVGGSAFRKIPGSAGGVGGIDSPGPLAPPPGPTYPPPLEASGPLAFAVGAASRGHARGPRKRRAGQAGAAPLSRLPPRGGRGSGARTVWPASGRGPGGPASLCALAAPPLPRAAGAAGGGTRRCGGRRRAARSGRSAGAAAAAERPGDRGAGLAAPSGRPSRGRR